MYGDESYGVISASGSTRGFGHILMYLCTFLSCSTVPVGTPLLHLVPVGTPGILHTEFIKCN